MFAVSRSHRCESASKVFRAPQSCCDGASECAVKPAATAKAGGPQGPARSLGWPKQNNITGCGHGNVKVMRCRCNHIRSPLTNTTLRRSAAAPSQPLQRPAVEAALWVD
ncbi:unnamed protein product [Gadus morhua 'NCC']